MSSVQAEACVLSLALGERGELEQRHGSLTCVGYTQSKKLLFFIRLRLNWVSCAFPGSPTPEDSFVTGFVKHVNPEMNTGVQEASAGPLLGTRHRELGRPVLSPACCAIWSCP